MTDTELPPHDLAAEQAVLGAIMATRQTLTAVRPLLPDPAQFFRSAHQTIYAAILHLADRDRPTDAIAVADHLDATGELKRVGHRDYLLEIYQAGNLVTDPTYHAGIVARHGRHRRAQEALKTAAGRLATGSDDITAILTAARDDLDKAVHDTAAGRPTDRRGLTLTPASQIRIRPVRWLWDTTPHGQPPTSQGRIPQNSLTLAAGGPGLGKSQFGVWLAARITRGELPGELHGKPRGVIYAATEDSWAYTIAPRLIAAGADMDLVFRVDVKDDGEPHARLTLPLDTSLIGQAAEEYSVALLIADPLLSLIDRTINDYRAAEVRAALEPLVAAADQHHFTILGLAHFTKNGAADPLSRVAGSGAFGQLIRSLIAFAKQEDENGDATFVMSLEKNNLGRLDVPSHEYAIQPITVDTPEGPSYVSRFVLGPETSTSVRDAMREDNLPDGSRAEANEVLRWLRDYLTDTGGSDDAKDIKKAARSEGFSNSALHRAVQKLGIKIHQTGFGKDRRSYWTLPEADTEKDSE